MAFTPNTLLRTMAAIAMLVQLSGCATFIMAGAVGGAVVVNERRTVLTQVDDHGLEVEVTDLLKEDKQLRNGRIVVIVMNQRVLLVGQVPTQELIERAHQIAKDHPDTLQVHNQLRIGHPINLPTSSNDGWITAKVKSRMFSDEALDVLRIKVVTENSEVFLLGLVNAAEADQAVQLARTTAGVRKVVKVFEYLQ